jgi:hypothetical protein
MFVAPRNRIHHHGHGSKAIMACSRVVPAVVVELDKVKAGT